MTGEHHDPWTRWYDAYRLQRATLKQAAALARDRKRAADVFVGLLALYMLAGGVAASVAVGLVMAN